MQFSKMWFFFNITLSDNWAFIPTSDHYRLIYLQSCGHHPFFCHYHFHHISVLNLIWKFWNFWIFWFFWKNEDGNFLGDFLNSLKAPFQYISSKPSSRWAFKQIVINSLLSLSCGFFKNWSFLTKINK